MKIREIESLIKQAENDALVLLPLTAKFLDFAASSKSEVVNYYNTKLNELFALHANVPFVEPLIYLTDGATNFYLTKYQAALENVKKGINSFRNGMPKDILGALHWALGLIYRSIGELDLAVENHLISSESINQTGPFKITYAYTLYQLGEIHIAIKEFNESKNYYERALVIVKDSDDTTVNFRLLNGLGNCNRLLNDYTNSNKLLLKALDIFGLSVAEKARGLCDLGVLRLAEKKYSAAQSVLNQSLELRVTKGLKDATSTSMLYLGQTYFLTGRYNEAIDILKEALIITQEFKTKDKKIKVLYWLFQAYEKTNEIESALNTLREYEGLNTEIRNKQEQNILKLKNSIIEQQRKEVVDKNSLLRKTLDELAKVKISRKSLIFSIITAIVLVILTELFLDPIIESLSYNEVISLGVKAIIALMLKPMESLYDRILMRRMLKQNER